jgi:hypothetical protein
MPLPPSFTCPVCQKKKQRGLLGVHLVKHSKAELLPLIKNLDQSQEPGWHPELDCSDHTYILCCKNEKGFEKDKPLHKSHNCTHNYSDWAKNVSKSTKVTKPRDDSLQSKTMQEVIDICKAKGIGGYSGLRKNEIIKLIENNNKPHAVGCDCHIEITKLKEELESYKKWKHTLLTCMPGSKYEPEPAFVVTLPQENIIEEHEQEKEKDEETTPVQTLAKPQVTFHASVHTKASKPMASKPMPSKKELEKGMWCTKCESCKFTAQYTKDLRPCGACNKLCHFNDDMGNCYLWDCVGCAKAVCKECNKTAGGNRLNPYCSKACANSNAV